MTGTTRARRMALGSMVAAAAMMAALPAAATKMVATYAGTVGFGNDTAGFFGGGNLRDKDYVAVFTYDTDDFSANLGRGSDRTDHVVSGWYSLTINGGTVSAASAINVRLRDEQIGRTGVTYDLVEHDSGAASNYVGQFLALSVFDELDFVSGLSSTQVIEYRRDVQYGESGGTFAYADGSRLYLDTTYVSIAPAAMAAVPEPASWMLMLAGFATLAASLRVRRRRVAFG